MWRKRSFSVGHIYRTPFITSQSSKLASQKFWNRFDISFGTWNRNSAYNKWNRKGWIRSQTRIYGACYYWSWNEKYWARNEGMLLSFGRDNADRTLWSPHNLYNRVSQVWPPCWIFGIGHKGNKILTITVTKDWIGYIWSEFKSIPEKSSSFVNASSNNQSASSITN